MNCEFLNQAREIKTANGVGLTARQMAVALELGVEANCLINCNNLKWRQAIDAALQIRAGQEWPTLPKAGDLFRNATHGQGAVLRTYKRNRQMCRTLLFREKKPKLNLAQALIAKRSRFLGSCKRIMFDQRLSQRVLEVCSRIEGLNMQNHSVRNPILQSFHSHPEFGDDLSDSQIEGHVRQLLQASAS